MLKRLLVSLIEGSLAGAVVAFALSRLVPGTPGAALMYAAAGAAGALTGLVAGKPIWARAAKLEGLLKAVTGAFIAVTVLFGMRKWLPGVTVDLTRFGAGTGPIGEVAWAALPAIAVALSLVLEIDDAFGAKEPPPAPRQRVLEESHDASLEEPDEEAAHDVARRGEK